MAGGVQPAESLRQPPAMERVGSPQHAAQNSSRVSRRILLVEHRPDVAEALQGRLAAEGFAVIPVRDGSQALPSAAATRPDVILLELTLPEIDGLEVCRRLRVDRRTAHMPVMILSEAVEEPVKVLGFEVGANDFLARPFGLDEFAARVKSLMRRVGGPRTSGVLSGGRVELDLDRYQVTVGGRPVTLTAKQLALLCELMSMSGIALRRSYLNDRIGAGGKGTADGLRTIDTLIARLRGKLGSEGRRIVTVRGVGYRFERTPEAKRMKGRSAQAGRVHPVR